MQMETNWFRFSCSTPKKINYPGRIIQGQINFRKNRKFHIQNQYFPNNKNRPLAVLREEANDSK
jgi:hypothetical protein